MQKGCESYYTKKKLSGGLNPSNIKGGKFEFVKKRSSTIKAGCFKLIFVHTNDNKSFRIYSLFTELMLSPWWL